MERGWCFNSRQGSPKGQVAQTKTLGKKISKRVQFNYKCIISQDSYKCSRNLDKVRGPYIFFDLGHMP